MTQLAKRLAGDLQAHRLTVGDGGREIHPRRETDFQTFSVIRQCGCRAVGCLRGSGATSLWSSALPNAARRSRAAAPWPSNSARYPDPHRIKGLFPHRIKGLFDRKRRIARRHRYEQDQGLSISAPDLQYGPAPDGPVA